MEISNEEALFHLIDTNGTTYEQYLNGISKISNINFTDRLFHRSYLHVSVQADKKEIFLDLLERGIDVNIQDKKGNTAAVYTTASEKWDWLKEVFKYNLDMSIKNNVGETLLMKILNYATPRAIDNAEKCELIEMALKLGADPNSGNIYGITPLQIAVRRKDAEILKLFSYLS